MTAKARLADDLHPLGERGQHRLEALDHHFMVVDQHDSHRSDSRCHAITIEPPRRFGAQPSSPNSLD
jgi:hypothetical protein